MSVDFPETGVLHERYQLESVIAEGGFSRVYRARDIEHDRAVAIKVLRPTPKRAKEWAPGEFEKLAQRFEREASILLKLKSPHSVRVYAHGVEDGAVYTVMELVEGRTVGAAIRDDGAFGQWEAVEILEQVLDALLEAHGMGVLHRDLKPTNLMLVPAPTGVMHVKVLDFGLAKGILDDVHNVDLTTEGSVIGTPRYMSPEQIEGKTLGPTTDIYSLGLVLYEMLSGVQAIRADSTIEIIALQVAPTGFQLPDQLELAPRLRRVLMKMVEKKSEHRYQNVEEVLADLRDWASGDAVLGLGESTAIQEDAPASEVADVDAPPERRRQLIWLAVVAVLVVLVLIVFAMRA